MDSKIKPVMPKRSQSSIFIGRTHAEAPIPSHLRGRADSLEKTLMLGKIEGKKVKGVAENKLVRQHHRLNGHECEKTLGDCEEQGSLATLQFMGF